ncbi:MAG TPA: 30S ribosomal protein S6 [Desulfohalobiaceae bacterium]|nr:30S ribosomal protein S6 [Desulfohalobiaceae bacterium]
MARKYETLLLFSPDLTSDERQEMLDSLTKVVEDYSGQVLTVDDWGTRELAYPVKKHTRGQYIRLEYGASGDTVSEIERKIRISDGILKFMTVQLEQNFQFPQEVA